MSITVNTNMSSLICQSSLNRATNGLNTALQRMSTGLRINSSKDDAAGYAISSKFSTKINSYNQAMRNTQDGVSYLQTADGALGTMEQMLSRMRDLAEKSANGAYGKEERNAMQTEINSIANELSRIKDSTEFNGIKMFESDFTGVDTHNNGKAILPTDSIGSYKVEKLTFEDIKFHYDENAIELNANDAQKIVNGTLAVENGKTYVLAADNEKALQKILQGNKTGKTFLTSDINMSEEWTAIGTFSSTYKGTFNGNGYTISGLKINNTSSDNQGLFGYVDAANISNTIIDNANVTGNNKIGILIGAIQGNTHVSNCSVKGALNGNSELGGLVGYKTSGTISNCDANVNIYSDSKTTTGESTVGGLVGYQRNGGFIQNCYASGSIEAIGINNISLGGFIGKNDMNRSAVNRCYSSGNISATVEKGYNNNIGGFIGQNINTGTIDDCKSSGKILVTVIGSTTSNPNIGGFIGRNVTNATVNNSYSSNTIESNETIAGKNINAGGFAGSNENSSTIKASYSTGKITKTGQPIKIGGFLSNNSSGTVTDCFWDTDSSGLTTSTAGIGKTTADLKGNTDFVYPDTWATSNWRITKDNYPELLWEPLPPTPPVEPKLKNINLQVGINADSNSIIKVTTGLAIKDFNVDVSNEKDAQNALSKIDKMLAVVTNSKTNIGASLNRLDSVLDFQNNQVNIISSANSLIKDADIAKESASYIKNQILQQTTSTLLATANQNPSIALGLI